MDSEAYRVLIHILILIVIQFNVAKDILCDMFKRSDNDCLNISTPRGATLGNSFELVFHYSPVVVTTLDLSLNKNTS